MRVLPQQPRQQQHTKNSSTSPALVAPSPSPPVSLIGENPAIGGAQITGVVVNRPSPVPANISNPRNSSAPSPQVAGGPSNASTFSNSSSKPAWPTSPISNASTNASPRQASASKPDQPGTISSHGFSGLTTAPSCAASFQSNGCCGGAGFKKDAKACMCPGRWVGWPEVQVAE